ncbi:PIN domain nuclease [Actinoplanes rectilineatus]|uniref:PIN domain nuclease n=1 Tax=Actinoplanes rectilineatus TaxID=113571 RepID=UPI0005F2DA16|nr:PIN domain nuclease [Actinoplanes rectilineatus]
MIRYLIDTSAFFRLLRNPELQERWRGPIESGSMAICPLTELEIYHSAQTPEQRARWKEVLEESYCWVVITDRVFDRAPEIQEGLFNIGAHRSAGPVDLVVAAVAEDHRMTLLHYDNDFTQVAKVTGQPTRWVAAPGSVN